MVSSAGVRAIENTHKIWQDKAGMMFNLNERREHNIATFRIHYIIQRGLKVVDQKELIEPKCHD